MPSCPWLRFLLKSKSDAAACLIPNAADVFLAPAASIALLLNAGWYENGRRATICRAPSFESILCERKDDYEFAAVDSFEETVSKILLTDWPVLVTAATATRAINATSSAYSSRSWPESSRVNARMRVIRFFTGYLLRVHDAQIKQVCEIRSRPPRHAVTQPILRNGCATAGIAGAPYA
jgi:hypothetical protein